MSTIYREAAGDIIISHSIDIHPNQNDFNMHIHSHNEIFLFVSGDATCNVEGNQYDLEAGSIQIIRESESHAVLFRSDAPYERYVLSFPSSAVGSFAGADALLSPFYDRRLGTQNQYLPSTLSPFSPLALFRKMCLPDASEDVRRLAIVSHLPSLLFEISRAFALTDRPDSTVGSQAGKIIAYINDHLFEDLSLERISSEFYMSASQIERIIKKHTHSSPGHYISRKRLSAARAKIESGESASRAALECGFGEYSSFYRAYIKEYGVPPTAHKH